MAENQNSIITDAVGLQEKGHVMRDQHRNAALFSISEMFKFMAAITVPLGMAMVIPALVEGIKAAGTAGIATALVGAPVGLAFLGVAAAATAIAIGAHFAASRYYHSANFDALEVNAKHTAKYLIKEIKAENACIQTQEHPQNVRADGKPWTQVVNKPTEPTQQPTR